jgi:hypothetical protein
LPSVWEIILYVNINGVTTWLLTILPLAENRNDWCKAL